MEIAKPSRSGSCTLSRTLRFNYEERRGVGDNSVGRDEGKKSNWQRKLRKE